MELTDTKIETAVVGLFIQAAQAKYQIPVAKNGEVSFSAKLIRDFLENYQVTLRVEGDGSDLEKIAGGPTAEGIHRAVVWVEPRTRTLGDLTLEEPETDPNAALIDREKYLCPRCGEATMELGAGKCLKCGFIDTE